MEMRYFRVAIVLYSCLALIYHVNPSFIDLHVFSSEMGLTTGLRNLAQF